MTMPALRGYGITQTAAFIGSDYFQPDVRQRIMDGLPPETKAVLSDIKPAEWYSREHVMHMLRSIATVKDNDDGSRRDLAACGRFVATEATNTFLKLFMKILTPSIFAKKMPDLWLRDHRGSGQFELDMVDASKGTLKMRLVGADGFDHVGALSLGYFEFCFNAMGAKGLNVVQRGWSLATPSPHEVEYEATWKV